MSSINIPPLILRLVHESTGIADTAGKIVRKVLKAGKLDIVDKGINDLQTKADRCAQVYIIQELHKRFPLATVIGEEGDDVVEDLGDLVSPPTTPSSEELSPYAEILSKNVPAELASIKESEVVFWIDPLDGTSEFTKGFVEHVTVLVGVAWKGSPVGGVIHQPFLQVDGAIVGRTLWGIPGVGYGGFDLKSGPANKRIITTTLSHSNARVEAALSSLKADEIVRVGGAGNKALLLLEGRAHAYVFASPGCKKWDTCAPEAVLKAVGGDLTDMDGNKYSYVKDVEHVNHGGLLATAPGQDHSWYVQQIPK